MTTKTKSETSSTVLRAIKVLNYLKEVPGSQALSDISQSLDLSPTIVHRLLTTLKSEGLVFQDPRSKLYSLGTVFLDYANKILTEMPLAPLVEPQLVKLRDLTGETVGFYVPSGNVRICVMEYESQQEIRRSVGIGRRIPLHLGASGRVILAHMSQDMQDQILASLPDTQKEEIKKRLAQTLQKGYSTNEEEITPNVGALSVPVFDHQKRIIGALSASGPVYRWNMSAMTSFVPVLRKAAKEITASFE
ncbi:IclR family transcriptional regulator [Ammoniphilus sp. CFH 90114]|uniref:IclR family transcriptional regulator n=1 Tax=Ammoniphilus sp. CFH 90114 TaxID=2493665 RepID=UPI00100FF410|nr:IclR family transcriptional regulator [Ammoniphilus sp. CFH 90114]RXT05291.1 IclR family transcriptional regulator [Ammoniphilus sp. CFH 90114]